MTCMICDHDWQSVSTKGPTMFVDRRHCPLCSATEVWFDEMGRWVRQGVMITKPVSAEREKAAL